MSYSKVYLHFVWTTKNRYPYINKNIKRELLDHFNQFQNTQNMCILEINCMEDHVHALISIHVNIKISEVAQKLKGESSYWINKNNLTRSKFQWAKKYYVSSVSEKHLNIVRNYIIHQERHHTFRSLDDEID
jgi:putative transposase